MIVCVWWKSVSSSLQLTIFRSFQLLHAKPLGVSNSEENMGTTEHMKEVNFQYTLLELELLENIVS